MGAPTVFPAPIRHDESTSILVDDEEVGADNGDVNVDTAAVEESKSPP